MELMSTRQVAAILGVSPRTVEQMRADGRGPAWVRVGGQVRYEPAQLAAWIAEHTGPTALVFADMCKR